MKSINARAAKNQFGALLEAARREPVIVTRHDRPIVAVVPLELLAEMPAYRAASVDKSRRVDIGRYIGRAKGLFASPKEVDAFIAAERKSWR